MSWFWQKKSTRVLVAAITNPDAASDQFASDAAIFSGHYSQTQCCQANSVDELCGILKTSPFDVVHLHANVRAGDRNAISEQEMGDLLRAIKKSKTGLVWFAQENGIDDYMAAFRGRSTRPAHMVMTVERKGEAFSSFLKNLLRELVVGESLADSWVKLVPQADGPWQETLPGCLLELGTDGRRYWP